MNTKKIRNNFSDYFWFNRWMLEFCGVLPAHEKGFQISFLFTVLTLVSCCFLVLPGFYTIALGDVYVDATEKVNIIGESLEILVGAIKMIALLPYRSCLFFLSQSAARLWDRVRTDADLRIVEPYSRRGLYLTYGFAGNVFFALISLLVAPIFMRYEYNANGTMLASKSLPYSAGIMHEDGYAFYVWWALQVPAGFIGIIPIVGIDTSIGFFVLQACAHLRLLQSRFRNVAEAEVSACPEKKSKIMKADYRKMIVECINTHQEIICFCDEIEYIFRVVVLIQMILSITAICGFGFNLLVQEKDRVKYGLHLIGAAVQLLIFCWPADNLQKESTDIGFEALNIRWYNWINKDKKLVEFIIMRSQRPISLTAGKFSIMSLETFGAVLSSAFSFFSILRKTL